MVVEQPGGNELRHLPRLLRERIVFLGTPVDDAVADSIVAQLFLDAEEKTSSHQFSGRFSDSGSIYDTMQIPSYHLF